jgi:putative nucleotidyltransferase with HDIG domain
LSVALRAGSAGDLQRRLHTDISDHDMHDAAAHVLGLVAALSRHDRRTRGHAERVRGYARLMAQELDLDPEDADRLQWAALLHDIGKLRVAPEILNKRGKLTDEEWAQIRTHPEAGADIVRPFAEWLGPWADVVAQHHERFDGHGYPYSIAGKDISLGARIVAVIDTYDVITAARSYKRAISSTKARAEIARCSGTQFDPDIVQAFLNISLGRVRFSAGPLAGLTQLPFITAVAQPGFTLTAAAATLPGAVPAAAILTMTGVVGMGPISPAVRTAAGPAPATISQTSPGLSGGHPTGGSIAISTSAARALPRTRRGPTIRSGAASSATIYGARISITPVTTAPTPTAKIASVSAVIMSGTRTATRSTTTGPATHSETATQQGSPNRPNRRTAAATSATTSPRAAPTETRTAATWGQGDANNHAQGGRRHPASNGVSSSRENL